MSCILYTLKVHVIPTKCTAYKIQVYVLTIILYTQKAERARWAARGRDQKKNQGNNDRARCTSGTGARDEVMYRCVLAGTGRYADRRAGERQRKHGVHTDERQRGEGRRCILVSAACR